jgi:hypothetical protein
VADNTLIAPEPYNPLDKRNLGKSVADALVEAPDDALPPALRFVGAGVYAIYYVGDFGGYASLAVQNKPALVQPIYVGKAISAGARKGNYSAISRIDTPLWRRLEQHGKSIIQTENLRIEDFRCRYLVVDDIFVSLGERLLIDTFRPVWNRVIDGFGNHDPGSGRYKGDRPRWDVLHPGRSWADRLDASRSVASVLDELNAFVDLGVEPIGVKEPEAEYDPSGA